MNEIDFYCYETIDDIEFDPKENDDINVYKETKTEFVSEIFKFCIINDTDIPSIYYNNICNCGLFHKVQLIYSLECK